MKTIEETIKDYAIECGCPHGGNVAAMDIEAIKIVAERYAQQYIDANKELVEMLADIKDYLGSDKRQEVEQLITKSK